MKKSVILSMVILFTSLASATAMAWDCDGQSGLLRVQYREEGQNISILLQDGVSSDITIKAFKKDRIAESSKDQSTLSSVITGSENEKIFLTLSQITTLEDVTVGLGALSVYSANGGELAKDVLMACAK